MNQQVGIRELKDGASTIIERVVRGEAITVTKRGKAVAQIVSADLPAHLAGLVAEGRVQPPGSGPRFEPHPAKLAGSGKTAAEYVSEGRR